MELLDLFRKKLDIGAGLREFRAQRRAMLVDVREKPDYAKGHLAGSRNIPFSQISKTPSAIHDKDMPIYVYCQNGSASRKAEAELTTMGYTNVKNIGALNDYTGKLVK